MRKFKQVVRATFLSIASLLIIAPHVSAIAITSPSDGQVPASGTTIVSGTATADSTVVISNNGATLSAVIADGSGDWSTTVSGLSAGNHTLTATEIGQSYGYFPALSGTNTINRILSGGTTINPGGGGFPVTSTTGYLLPSGYSPQLGLMYFGTGSTTPPGQFDLNTPADPVAATAYPAGANPGSGATTLDGTQVYIANDATDNVAVVDYATNNTVDTITMPTGYYSTASTAPSGEIYVPGDEIIHVIDPNTNTITRTVDPGCPTTVAGLSYPGFVPGQDYYYIACEKDGLFKKMSSIDDSVIRTYDVSGTFTNVSVIYENPINSKLYVQSTYGSGTSDTIAVVDKDSGDVDSTITLTATSFASVPTPDNQYLYAPTQGPLDGSVLNIDVIDTSTNTVIANIDTSSVGIPGVMVFSSPQNESTTLDITVASAQNATQTETLADTGTSTYLYIFVSMTLISSFLGIKSRFLRN